MTPEILFKSAVSLHQQGEMAGAEKLYRQALAQAPENFATHYMLGMLCFQEKRYSEALELIEAARAYNPRSHDALALYGVLLHHAGRVGEALDALNEAVAAKPDDASHRYNRALVLVSLGRFAEALSDQDKATALCPERADAWRSRALTLAELGRDQEALAAMDQVLALDAADAEAWKISAFMRQRMNRQAEAVTHLDRCLSLSPLHAEAWYLRGLSLSNLKRYGEARASFDKVLEINPHHAEALYRRGVAVWMGSMDYDAAASDLELAIGLNPDLPYLPGWLWMIHQYVGNWSGFAADADRINHGVRAGKKVAEPFHFQAVSQTPADLLACCTIYTGDRYPAKSALAQEARQSSGKLRIGYVSGEFRDQATAHLTAGLYECHDRDRFEIIGFDNGWDDGSLVRKRLNDAIQKIVDISSLSGRQAAEAVFAERPDILVNLNGYFGDHRMDVFARRPAPVQVNYLGFPGTLGATYIDYLVADRVVIPETDKPYFMEKIVYLPNSYQINDGRRPFPGPAPSRAFFGLPEKAFVFCNFNASYKLTPETFAGWMRILRKVPASILWLLEFHPRFSDNLRRQAEAEGVAAGRILFAPVVGHEAHMARLGAADLVLDSLPYNAHTTASDALWAGVPLITREGTAFAGRVAASCLAALNLPELITKTQEEFETLAVTLAHNPALLDSIRLKLAGNRVHAPLFDTAGFTRNLEAAYQTMWDINQRREPPRDFAV